MPEIIDPLWPARVYFFLELPQLDHRLNAASGTVLIENGQSGIESRALAIFLSADYKGVAPGAPTGTLRANVARQEDVGCNTSRKISSVRFVS